MEIGAFALSAAVAGALAFSGAPAPQAAPHSPVFVAFVGQSNMVGFNMSPATLAVTGWQQDPMTFIWNNQTSQFEVMQPGVNSNGGVGVWGPEVRFAMDFRAEHPDTLLYITRTVAGSTSLVQNMNDQADWNPDSTGEMFDKALARIDAASAVVGHRPDAVFILQGESESFDVNAMQQYYTEFPEWIAAIRAEWMQDPNGFVAWARIGGPGEWVPDVRMAQYLCDVDTENTASFDTWDPAAYPRQSDGLHLDAQGLVNVGRDFYSLFDAAFPF